MRVWSLCKQVQQHVEKVFLWRFSLSFIIKASALFHPKSHEDTFKNSATPRVPRERHCSSSDLTTVWVWDRQVRQNRPKVCAESIGLGLEQSHRARNARCPLHAVGRRPVKHLEFDFRPGPQTPYIQTPFRTFQIYIELGRKKHRPSSHYNGPLGLFQLLRLLA